MNYPNNGDHATALFNVLFAIMGKGQAGATQQEIIDAYEDAKGHTPSTKTIYRIIETLNDLFDSAWGFSFAPASEEQCENQTRSIVARGRGDQRRYIFTRDPKLVSHLDNPVVAFLMAMQNNPHERGVMPQLFEVLMKILVGDIFNRISEWYQLQGEIEKYVLIKGFQPVHLEDSQHKIETILTAIRDRKHIRFAYRHIGNGELQKREAAPYGLLCHQNVWYLSGLCCRQNELRLFRLDHMESPHRLELSSFDLPASFSLEKQYGTSWGVWTEDHAIAEVVKLRVDERLAEKFKVTCYHTTQRLRELPGGGLEVDFHVAGAEEMLPWLMMWGPTVEVLEPAWLRQAMIDNLAGTFNLYA